MQQSIHYYGYILGGWYDRCLNRTTRLPNNSWYSAMHKYLAVRIWGSHGK